MLKNRIEEVKIDGEDIIPRRIIIEVPLSFEMIQDCFSYSDMDAPSEIKRMMMESLGETIDALILSERPEHVNEKLLMSKLNKVKVIVDMEKNHEVIVYDGDDDSEIERTIDPINVTHIKRYKHTFGDYTTYSFNTYYDNGTIHFSEIPLPPFRDAKITKIDIE